MQYPKVLKKHFLNAVITIETFYMDFYRSYPQNRENQTVYKGTQNVLCSLRNEIVCQGFLISDSAI